MLKQYIIGMVVLSLAGFSIALKAEDCEVCVKVLDEVAQSLEDLSAKDRQDAQIIESRMKKYCKDKKNKIERFCYYVGASETSATGILNEVSKPMSYFMPSLKICEKLKKLDNQICDLRFDKQIDLSTVDLKKLKVKDLKKILNDWDEVCDGCLEKTDYIRRIEELKPTYYKETKPTKQEL